jgi:hypothetical protein
VQQLKVEGWMKLCEGYELVDDEFTLPQAVLAFVWARMTTVDEARAAARPLLAWLTCSAALWDIAWSCGAPATSCPCSQVCVYLHTAHAYRKYA